MNNLKRHEQPHLTKVTFYSSIEFVNTLQTTLNRKSSYALSYPSKLSTH